MAKKQKNGTPYAFDIKDFKRVDYEALVSANDMIDVDEKTKTKILRDVASGKRHMSDNNTKALQVFNVVNNSGNDLFVLIGEKGLPWKSKDGTSYVRYGNLVMRREGKYNLILALDEDDNVIDDSAIHYDDTAKVMIHDIERATRKATAEAKKELDKIAGTNQKGSKHKAASMVETITRNQNAMTQTGLFNAFGQGQVSAIVKYRIWNETMQKWDVVASSSNVIGKNGKFKAITINNVEGMPSIDPNSKYYYDLELFDEEGNTIRTQQGITKIGATIKVL